MPIPPPTKESREQAIKEANKLGEKALMGIRAARAVMQKKFRTMVFQKYRMDHVLKAQTAMEKVVKSGMEEVEEILNTLKKGIEQSF